MGNTLNQGPELAGSTAGFCHSFVLGHLPNAIYNVSLTIFGGYPLTGDWLQVDFICIKIVLISCRVYPALLYKSHSNFQSRTKNTELSQAHLLHCIFLTAAETLNVAIYACAL